MGTPINNVTLPIRSGFVEVEVNGVRKYVRTGQETEVAEKINELENTVDIIIGLKEGAMNGE